MAPHLISVSFYIKRDGGRENQNRTLNSCSLRAAKIQRFDFGFFYRCIYIYIPLLIYIYIYLYIYPLGYSLAPIGAGAGAGAGRQERGPRGRPSEGPGGGPPAVGAPQRGADRGKGIAERVYI